MTTPSFLQFHTRTPLILLGIVLLLLASARPALAGGGTFKNGAFDFCVSVRFNATAAQLADIQTAFRQASALLEDATDGQHRFGEINIVNNDTSAAKAAEFWIVPPQDPSIVASGGQAHAPLAQNWEEKRFARGASTITQQLAKNLFLSPSKNPLRKLHEALIAEELESVLEKRRILELYLNTIEWGDGVYGAEAAARRYFNTSAASLDVDQAAFLAAIIPNPREQHDPSSGTGKDLQRASRIRALMEHPLLVNFDLEAEESMQR